MLITTGCHVNKNQNLQTETKIAGLDYHRLFIRLTISDLNSIFVKSINTLKAFSKSACRLQIHSHTSPRLAIDYITKMYDQDQDRNFETKTTIIFVGRQRPVSRPDIELKVQKLVVFSFKRSMRVVQTAV